MVVALPASEAVVQQHVAPQLPGSSILQQHGSQGHRGEPQPGWRQVPYSNQVIKALRHRQTMQVDSRFFMTVACGMGGMSLLVWLIGVLTAAQLWLFCTNRSLQAPSTRCPLQTASDNAAGAAARAS